jgi:hypothetical protein
MGYFIYPFCAELQLLKYFGIFCMSLEQDCTSKGWKPFKLLKLNGFAITGLLFNN